MEKRIELPNVRIGIDIGGTFTDFVIYRHDTGELNYLKLPSTPENPAMAVLLGLERCLDSSILADSKGNISILHGSTVATNALVERKGASMALITTSGFGDVLQIGRQNRPALYDFSIDPLPPLVPESLRFELDERIDKDGNVIQSLDPLQVSNLVERIKNLNLEAVAVCFLFSFVNPQHEQAVEEAFWATNDRRDDGDRIFVCASHKIHPVYREYERTSTTVVNAYVSPILSRYLTTLEKETRVRFGNNREGDIRFGMMQSNGGFISLEQARRNGVRCVLSGPAGGISGARFVADQALKAEIQGNPDEKLLKIITFDMGGTSTDVSLIIERPLITTEAYVGGHPISVPVLDIHTIGAGGGSIARVDFGGALLVGPDSAGADPGPACYGKGDMPTVTDANLVLGRLDADFFLGGSIPLDNDRAEFALAKLGDILGVSQFQVALGVIEVSTAHMERALRVISVERGYDPRDFTLLSFGGAGGLHAAELARRIGIPRVIVPPMASTLSAFGMVTANIVKDYSKTVMLPGDTPLLTISGALDDLIERGMLEVCEEGVPREDIFAERFVDMRYRGQSYELTVPFDLSVAERFRELHETMYGYTQPGAQLEIVNVRVRITGLISPPIFTPKPHASDDPSQALIGFRPVIIGPVDEFVSVPFYRGELLECGNRIQGPAIVLHTDTTIYLSPSDRAKMDSYDNLIIFPG